MISEIKETLERKKIKYLLLVISFIGFAACIIAMQEQIINFIINVVETKVLNRELKNLDKWKDYLFGMGYSFTIFIVLLWYFYIRRKTVSSLCFLLVSFGTYLFTYKLFAADRGGDDILRFPLFFLLPFIIFHIVVNRRYFVPSAGVLKDIKLRLAGNSFFNSSLFVFICGGLLGSLFFLYIFGTAVLDFTYTDWLMSGGDLSQHYLGWKLFRNSSWYFPIGLMDNIVYPFKISMIYTDSIPLFAVFFKLLSPVLPENFQYFGLFGIMCYALQGGCAALIVRKIGGDVGQSIIGSSLFTLSTVMTWRLYFHTSLAAHFIILLCILVCLDYTNYSFKKQIVVWSCLLVLCASIHLYFVPMVMVFMGFRLLKEYFSSRDIKKQCIVFGIPVLVLIGTMYCLGAFYFIGNAGTGELGIASANINAFVNPDGMSRFIKDMPQATTFQYEGNSYLGLGMILFILFILVYKTAYRGRQNWMEFLKRGSNPYILGIMLFFLLFSLSPVITFNQYKLFTYPMFLPIEHLWSIFRSTGRFTWPIIYIITTICVWWTITRFSAKKSVLILCVLLLIQCSDLGTWFVNKGNTFKTRVTWRTELASPAWDNLANDYKHIFYAGDDIKGYSFLDLAGNNKMTVNDAYLARSNANKITENKQKELSYLADNGPRDDTIYVFQDEEQALLFRGNSIHLFIIDEVLIGINSEKVYLDNYEF
jgi:hypothetical protein